MMDLNYICIEGFKKCCTIHDNNQGVICEKRPTLINIASLARTKLFVTYLGSRIITLYYIEPVHLVNIQNKLYQLYYIYISNYYKTQNPLRPELPQIIYFFLGLLTI